MTPYYYLYQYYDTAWLRLGGSEKEGTIIILMKLKYNNSSTRTSRECRVQRWTINTSPINSGMIVEESEGLFHHFYVPGIL